MRTLRHLASVVFVCALVVAWNERLLALGCETTTILSCNDPGVTRYGSQCVGEVEACSELGEICQQYCGEPGRGDVNENTNYCLPIQGGKYLGGCECNNWQQCPGCVSCDASPTCCSGCQGTWDTSLGYCNTGSPIIFNPSGGEIRLTAATDGVLFDLSYRGVQDRVAWTRDGSNAVFLVLDRNQNGVIDDGRELFGTATPLVNGSRAAHGFAALAEIDGRGNGNGRVDAADPEFALLKVWRDTNHNGFSEPAELRSLHTVGVMALGTQYRERRRVDRFGNWFRYEGYAWVATPAGVVRRPLVDVFLKIERIAPAPTP